MEMPPIRYATSKDGTAIAYTVLPGKSPPWFHIYSLHGPGIELDLAIESRRGFIEELAAGRATVLYDPRGRGLSAPIAGTLTIDDLVEDIDAVTCAVGEPMDVLAANTGAYAACIYAARKPELWRRMLLLAATVRWTDSISAQGSDVFPSYRAGIQHMLRTAMDVSLDELNVFVDRCLAALPEPAAAAYRTALASVDLSDVLPRIELETIVSARLGSIISHASVEVAGLIPGARLVVTGDGYHRPKLGRQLRELLEADVPENFRPSAFQTILFTDLESSTALTQRVGDDAAQDVLRGHNATVRAALEAHGGREVKHTGDGIMAAFPSAVRAVEAALQIQRDLAGGEVRVRMGLNAGEPISEDDDLFGTAVQLARRICDRADPGQVLVSRVVADLCAGKRLQFRHHSDATLKGFGEPVALYEVGQSDKVA